MLNKLRTSVIASLFLAVSAQTTPAAAQSGTTVAIDAGTIGGRITGDVLSFKGIPYAAPPVGARRWRSPQPVKPWAGARRAIEYGHDCMQKVEPADAAPLGTVPAEDCLVLNLWRPAAGAPDDRLPVLVWIHGGAYVNGGASTPIHDGSAFARYGLVFVSFNYRLGRFGFFAHPALIAADEGAVGNFGLMDQIEALRWVRRNIAAFGGNPDMVTAMGESAGGISVMALLTSPEGKGLFHRAIVLSGGGRTLLVSGGKLTGGTPTAPSADQIGMNFARGNGIHGTGPLALRALRALPADTVRGELNMSGLLRGAAGPPTAPTYVRGPIVDGAIVTSMPGDMLRRGEAMKVPVMIGSTSADLPVVLPPSRQNPLSFFGPETDEARALYNPAGKLNALELLLAVGVDMTMHEPARFVAQQMTRAGQPVWLYRFDYVVRSLRPKQAGAAHASELPFLFGTLDARYGRNATDKDRAAARIFGAYFANFAKQGDPNAAGLPDWAKYDPARGGLMQFTSDKGPVMGPDPWQERLDLVARAQEAQAASPDAARDLAGSWQLVRFRGGDDRVLVPDDKSKYTLAFEDGGVSVRIDCNRGRGTWRSAAASQLLFGPLALTRAMCPPAPLTDRLAQDWAFVRSYVIRDGRLFLSLMADAGIYEFERQ